MTQAEKILQYMKDYGSITQLEAADEFGCMRLAARIADLREDGVKIKREMVRLKSRYGETIFFAQYRLED